jgi:HlyD family secretion protein
VDRCIGKDLPVSLPVDCPGWLRFRSTWRGNPDPDTPACDQPIEAQLDIEGEVITAQQDKLYFRATGIVDQVNVKGGDFFKKGDVLAQLQINDLQGQLQQAQIDLKVSQDNLNIDTLQKAYDLQNAQSSVVIAQKNVELATLAFNNSSGVQRQTAQINLDIAQERLKTAQAAMALVEAQANSDLQQVVDRDQLTVQGPPADRHV